MAQLLVRNLDDSVEERLRRRAAGHGRGMEEEARVILQEALPARPRGAKKGWATDIAAQFRGIGFTDAEMGVIAERGQTEA